MSSVDIIIIVAVSALVAAIAWYIASTRITRQAEKLQTEISEAQRLRAEAEKILEAERREMQLAAKEEAIRLRAEVEKENKQTRAELDRAKKRLEEREDALERKKAELDRQTHKLEEKERALEQKAAEAEELLAERRQELERVARLSTQEAREILLDEVRKDIALESAQLIERAEREAREEGRRKAAWIIGQAIQRCAVEQTTDQRERGAAAQRRDEGAHHRPRRPQHPSL